MDVVEFHIQTHTHTHTQHTCVHTHTHMWGRERKLWHEKKRATLTRITSPSNCNFVRFEKQNFCFVCGRKSN